MSKIVDRIFWPVTLLGCTVLIMLTIVTKDAIIATHFSTPLPTPQPIMTTSLPKPTQIPSKTQMTIIEKETKSDSDDPIISCEVGPECGGGTKMIRRSVCDTSGCCQIGSQWVYYTSQAQCVMDQRAVSKDQQASKEKQAQQDQQQKEDTQQAKKLLFDICSNDAYRKANECSSKCGNDFVCQNVCTDVMVAEQAQCREIQK